jgi:hypothetical protein
VARIVVRAPFAKENEITPMTIIIEAKIISERFVAEISP